jgi:hypothetical protein
MTMSDDPGPSGSNPGEQSPDDKRTPFQRFEDVLRKVVAVPKTEVDERRRRQP